MSEEASLKRKKGEVAAIIILYRPDTKMVKDNIDALRSDQAINKIILVDNSETPREFKGRGLITHSFKENKGIAAAQNVGLELALGCGCKYAVLFDQDSQLNKALVSDLVNVFEESLVHLPNLVAIGPKPFDIYESKVSRLKVQKHTRVSDGLDICSQIIASGKLINLCRLKDVGLMDEGLFIDGVDYEWCWRAADRGFLVGMANKVVMRHALGDGRGKFLGVGFKIGAPIRLYYQFRNILVLSRRRYVPFYWKIRGIISIAARLFIFIFIYRDAPKKRLHYMLQGLYDGMKNKQGRCR